MPTGPLDATGRRIRVGDRVTVASAPAWRGTVAHVLVGPTVAWLIVRRAGQRWGEMVPPGAVLVAERKRQRRKGPPTVRDIEITMVERPKRRRNK